MTPEELERRLQALREKRLSEHRNLPSSPLLESLKTGLRYAERGARTAGLGVGAAYSQTLPARYARTVADKTPLPDDMWFLPGDRNKTLDAFRAFNEQRQQDDWDAAIAAAQDEFGAGPGFWGTSELAAEVLAPGGLAKSGTRLIKAADRFGDFAPAVRAVGQGLRMPWEAEEAVGRAAFAPFAAAFRGIRGRLRGDPTEAFADIDVSQPQLALGPGARPMPPPSARPMPGPGPVDEYLDEGIVPPSDPPPRLALRRSHSHLVALSPLKKWRVNVAGCSTEKKHQVRRRAPQRVESHSPYTTALRQSSM